MAKLKIEMLSKKIAMTTVDQAVSNQALSNRQIQDFEDGLEYYSALGSDCEVIVTEDSDGFYYSKIPVLGCEDFLRKYIY